MTEEVDGFKVGDLVRGKQNAPQGWLREEPPFRITGFVRSGATHFAQGDAQGYGAWLTGIEKVDVDRTPYPQFSKNGLDVVRNYSSVLYGDDRELEEGIHIEVTNDLSYALFSPREARSLATHLNNLADRIDGDVQTVKDLADAKDSVLRERVAEIEAQIEQLQAELESLN